MRLFDSALQPAAALVIAGVTAAGAGMLAQGLPAASLLWLAAPAAAAALAWSHLQTRAQADAKLIADQARESERARIKAAPETRFDMIEALPDPIVVISPDGRVAAVNAAGRGVFGEPQPGWPLSVYIRHPAVVEAVQEAAATGEPAEREATLGALTDRVFKVRVGMMQPERQLVLVLQDITQSRLTERMRVDFVANASHELRTPLSTLVGFIETLRGKAIDDLPRRERFLAIMESEAHRMTRLIDDLLSLSRIELDKHLSPAMPIDLLPLLRDVGRTLAIRLENGGRRIELATPDLLPLVIADRDQIIQVLHNLVSNALKYGRPDTSIILTASIVTGDSEDHVRVSVRDHGEGISPEHLPRLTERFYRVDTARSRSMGGTGLGLAIVKHIIERHRGSLSISSQVGEGTTVSFSLPVASTALS